jgi:drug/metabolite transporter (DMT)-like permease
MGIVAALLSAVFSTSKDVVSKKLTVRIDGTASTFASFAFALPFYLIVLGVLAFLGYDLIHFTAAFWWLVLARALTDVFAEGMKMYAFAHGDISLVTIVFSLSPLYLLAMSPWLPSERLSWQGTVAVIVVVAGSVALVYRPSHPEWGKQRTALLLGAGASLFFALNSLLDRLAMLQGQRDDPGSATMAGFTMTLTSAGMLLPFIVGHRERAAGMLAARRGLLTRGLLETAFMVCKLLAMQLMEAAYVVGLQRTSLLLSIIVGRVVFKEKDFGRRLLAGLLILAGVAWIVYEKVGRQ